MKKPQGEGQVIKFNTRLNDSKTEVVPPPGPYATTSCHTYIHL